jgi:hypothetical protein
VIRQKLVSSPAFVHRDAPGAQIMRDRGRAAAMKSAAHIYPPSMRLASAMASSFPKAVRRGR